MCVVARPKYPKDAWLTPHGFECLRSRSRWRYGDNGLASGRRSGDVTLILLLPNGEGGFEARFFAYRIAVGGLHSSPEGSLSPFALPRTLFSHGLPYAADRLRSNANPICQKEPSHVAGSWRFPAWPARADRTAWSSTRSRATMIGVTFEMVRQQLGA